MPSQRNALLERFFTAMISGDRHTAREIMDEVFSADVPAERIASNLIWPTLNQLQNMRRADQLSSLAYHYGTRLMRSITDQLLLRYEQHARRDQTVLVMSGPEESEELTGQLAADLLEADGYTVYYCGGGVSNDEITEQIANLRADKLVVFGSIPSTVPETRLLIDRLHDLGVCPLRLIMVVAASSTGPKAWPRKSAPTCGRKTQSNWCRPSPRTPNGGCPKTNAPSAASVALRPNAPRRKPNDPHHKPHGSPRTRSVGFCCGWVELSKSELAIPAQPLPWPA